MDVCFHEPQQSSLSGPTIDRFGDRQIKLEPPLALGQVYDARGNGLQVLRRHAGDRHAIMTEFDYRVGRGHRR
jgi:hypothetical protein